MFGGADQGDGCAAGISRRNDGHLTRRVDDDLERRGRRDHVHRAGSNIDLDRSNFDFDVIGARLVNVDERHEHNDNVSRRDHDERGRGDDHLHLDRRYNVDHPSAVDDDHGCSHHDDYAGDGGAWGRQNHEPGRLRRPL